MKLYIALTVLVLRFCVAVPLGAAPYYWNNTTNGTWSTPTCWRTSVVPPNSPLNKSPN
jgi:hypothetical protein